MRRVEITWHDAHGDNGSSWHPIDGSGWTDKPLVVKSIGYLMTDAKKGHHVLAQSVIKDHVDHVLFIPKAMTKRIRTLK
jgi:hypothetical protein